MAGAAGGYDGEAGLALLEAYEAVDPTAIHAKLLSALPAAPSMVLDIGSGSGRDAAWLARMGHEVVAIEPSPTMRAEAQRRHSGAGVTWLDDSLPALAAVYRLNAAFDVILLSAVWMHVPLADRPRAFRKCITLLKPGGLLYITLRLGPPALGREMHPVSVEEVERLAREHGALVVSVEHQPDQMGRAEVSWGQVLLRLPDDGTGALPLLRHVILNDAKSATYKLGLLRALARAADGAQGVARMVDDATIAVPLGLIALYWLRLYKPLIATGLPQMPRNIGPDGLGFVGQGWRALQDTPAGDLRVGAVFAAERAMALNAALRDAATTIARMPATYMTWPGSDRPILPVVRGRAGVAPSTILIDADYLWRFGEMHVPLHLWRALARYDAWIEPALVAEWARLMEGYALAQNRQLDPAAVARALRWHEPNRDVGIARRKALALLEEGNVFCVWTGKRLNAPQLDIDHCFPWAAWPCDDLWNLLPAHPSVNRHGKRDRLPSAAAIEASADRIADWWRRAWLTPGVAPRFWAEARASLPIQEPAGKDLAALFDGMHARRRALKVDQQVTEWMP